MAKSYKNANKICLILTIVAGLGILIALVQSSALLAIISLLPATVYEVYRTEGESTKLASWGMLGTMVGELVFILFNIDINVADFLQQSQGTVGGYTIPFGNLQVLAPTLLAVLSVVLITKTWGKFTKWLAIVNLVGAFAIIYILDPNIFSELLRLAVQEGMQEIQ
jgi:hypothetical protein